MTTVWTPAEVSTLSGLHCSLWQEVAGLLVWVISMVNQMLSSPWDCCSTFIVTHKAFDGVQATGVNVLSWVLGSNSAEGTIRIGSTQDRSKMAICCDNPHNALCFMTVLPDIHQLFIQVLPGQVVSAQKLCRFSAFALLILLDSILIVLRYCMEVFVQN